MAPTIIPQVTAAATSLDLVTLADVKLELKLTDATDDVWLQKVITRASRALARYCNRVFQPQGYQELVWADLGPYPWQLATGLRPLQLAGWPLSSPPSPAGTAPPLAPVLSSVGGGALGATIYFARVSYVTPLGETAASMEASLAVAANHLLQVTSPIPDNANVAIGWNLYLASKSLGEVKQNTAPIAIGTGFTLPTTGLVTGTSGPQNYILAVENWELAPTPLAEGADFISDYSAGAPDFSKGQLTRLFPMDQTPRRWQLPVLVQYQAGYATIPDDLTDAALQVVKQIWFARTRDPGLRSKNVVGVYEAQYWSGNGPGSSGAFPPEITALIDQFRVPVIG